MGFKIVWTKHALDTFAKNIDYLQQKWTEKEVRDFTSKVNDLLAAIRKQPLMYRKSEKLANVHIGLIVKQVSLVYRVKSRKKEIELIAFLDNRQGPKKRQA